MLGGFITLMHEIEEKLYEMAAEELVTKQVVRGVWAKAFATSQGDEARTKAAYIELRVTQLREQLKAEASHQGETADQKRKRMIQERLGGLRHVPYRDDESIPNSHFDGHPSKLANPVSVSIVADALGLTDTSVIIAIRSGYVAGVRNDGDWYVDLQPTA